MAQGLAEGANMSRSCGVLFGFVMLVISIGGAFVIHGLQGLWWGELLLIPCAILAFIGFGYFIGHLFKLYV